MAKDLMVRDLFNAVRYFLLTEWMLTRIRAKDWWRPYARDGFPQGHGKREAGRRRLFSAAAPPNTPAPIPSCSALGWG